MVSIEFSQIASTHLLGIPKKGCRLMKFQHRFHVKAPLAKVMEFHRRPIGLKSLTPPLAFMQAQKVPALIQQGDSLTFRMWLGPILVTWESQFPELTENSFTDIQGRGPFESWQHRHIFIQVDSQTTEIVDQIEAHLSRNLWRWFVGSLMWLTLPFLFWYRKIQTRRILEDAA
jgi:ligand-binding SRPBCC domain-containing protein